MSGLFIVAAKRTPFGAFGGALKTLTATDLGVVSSKAAIAQAQNLDPAHIDACFFGNVIQSSSDAAYLARHVALKSGCAITTPSLTINRLCGSGFETVIQGATAISVGDANIALCGGTEQMSMAPLTVSGNDARWGVPLGKGMKLGDSLWDGLTDAYAGTPMGITAENLAEKYGISRQECDEYAIRSQQTWGAAQKAGIFDLEMAPVTIESKKGTIVVDTDEHPRPDTALEKIAKLKPVFKKDGAVTAANASGICDGAGSVIVASEQAVQQYNLKPLARLVSYAVTGCDPTIMGIGPVTAIQQALAKADLSLAQVDRVEINEAFAAQFLACAKELELDMDKTNLHGGAISLGHPLGASGSRIVAHLANEFHQEGNTNQIHVGSACIGGGQGIAVVLERA
ncbi:Acetyl-CoA acetyltransferase [Seminavis robusta]|uniref:Acetyl-CoA acetyltransferase n=1 Tax=Seminavis robusta TaxID=568900 RepID=A0A9N8H8L9_9STRA|nr:Acetyl-CoA acetyltransferase [Seminavis robusta]|eukprot:Sro164_g073440.1 Acetyl-CoA acetyltransferase (399) ;mRNA; f:2813-4143